jgi:hypothetical protein
MKTHPTVEDACMALDQLMKILDVLYIRAFIFALVPSTYHLVQIPIVVAQDQLIVIPSIWYNLWDLVTFT